MLEQDHVEASSKLTPKFFQRGDQTRGPSLRMNLSWAVAGNTAYAGFQWAMLTALAKSSSPSVLGAFALALAIATPVYALTNLQLREIQATDANQEYAFSDYLGHRAVATGVGIGFVIVLSMTLNTLKPLKSIIIAVAIMKALDTVCDVFYGLLQQRERMKDIAISQIANGSISFIMFAGSLLATHSLLLAIAASTLVTVLIFFGYILPRSFRVITGQRLPWPPNWRAYSVESISPRWEADTLWRLSRLALPLGLVMLLVALNTSLPRYVISAVSGQHGVGIYSAIAYLMIAGATVITAVGQAVSPRLAGHFARGEYGAFQGLLKRLLVLASLGGGICVVASATIGPFVLRLLYTNEYARYSSLLILLTIAAVISFLASLLGYGITAARHFQIQPKIIACSVIANACACILLIPRFGLTGAGVASAVTSIVILAGYGTAMDRILNRAKERSKLYGSYV